MSDKFLFRIAIAAFATLIVAFGAVAALNFFGPKTPDINPNANLTAETNAHAVTHVDAIVRDSQTANPGSSQTSGATELPQFTMPINNAVHATDLLQLAHAVDLKNGAIDKSAWQKALPQAQQLLSQGSCDCESRNWLTHFVEAGNYALSGDSHYTQVAQMLVTMPKSDDEGTTHHISE